jgi:hypothetical protein
MVDKPNKPKKKVYSNEHPKYKDSKSYSEKEILEFNSAVKEKAKDWDSGKTGSDMKLVDSNIKSNMKIIDPKKRRLDGKLDILQTYRVN